MPRQRRWRVVHRERTEKRVAWAEDGEVCAIGIFEISEGGEESRIRGFLSNLSIDLTSVVFE